MHNTQDKLGVKNMPDLTRKAIKGIYDTDASTKEKKNTKDLGNNLLLA